MTRLHLVRHGPTHERRFVGWRDVPADLSDRAALARLSAGLPREALLVSSDLQRAVTTADALEAPGRRRLPHDPALREFHFGEWDGLDFTAVSASHPELSRAFWESPGPHAAPGGESWDQVQARVSAAIDGLIRAHPGAEIIVVAHIGVILAQRAHALGLTAAESIGQAVDNLSVTTLERRSSAWHAVRTNHVY